MQIDCVELNLSDKLRLATVSRIATRSPLVDFDSVKHPQKVLDELDDLILQ